MLLLSMLDAMSSMITTQDAAFRLVVSKIIVNSLLKLVKLAVFTVDFLVFYLSQRYICYFYFCILRHENKENIWLATEKFKKYSLLCDFRFVSKLCKS